MSYKDLFFNLYFEFSKPKENAGFLLRLIAFFIDLIILSFVSYFLITTFSLKVTVHSRVFEPIWLISHPYSILLNWLYYSLLESNRNYQGTIGKRIMKLKVVDVNNQTISFGRATLRFFSKYISGLTFGIGYIMIIFTKNKQGLHDLAAGTFVKVNYSL